MGLRLGIIFIGLSVLMIVTFVFAMVEANQGPAVISKDESGVHIRIGRFYRDVLKLHGDADIMERCLESEEYEDCIAQNTDQQAFAQNINRIQYAADIGKEHGIDYMSVPFVQDLLEE